MRESADWTAAQDYPASLVPALSEERTLTSEDEGLPQKIMEA